MALQNARYLLKVAQQAAGGQEIKGALAYLNQIKPDTALRCNAKSKDDFNCLYLIEQLLQYSSAHLIWKVAEKFATLMGEGHHMQTVWDKKAGISLFEASKAFVHCFTYSNFVRMIKEDVKDEKVAAVLKRLCLLYGIERILANPLGAIQSEYLQPVHFVYLKEKKEDLIDELRPDAIGLTDAFAYKDESLFSALAVSDGKVYETLLDWAMNKNDVNQEPLAEGYFKYIKPVMGKYSHLRPKL